MIATFAKQRLKDFMATTLSLLPNRARIAIASAVMPTLEPKDRYELISLLAADLNIVRFSVKGSHGIFESLSTDRSVLKGYALDGIWARRTLKLVSETLNGTAGTYIDIGANIGLTTVPITKLGPITCFAFEPEPHNFENLQTNAARNAQGGNLRLFQLALSDASGTAALSLAKGNLGDHQLLGENGVCAGGDLQTRDAIDVIVKPLDALTLEITHPLVIKIDTQGAEPMVLRGGAETVAKADLLIMEFWPYGISRFQNSAEDLFAFLSSNFQSISCALGEEDPLRSWASVSESLDFLRSFFTQQKLNAGGYLDIVARKLH